MNILALSLALATLAADPGLPNAFYAMDTYTRRPYPTDDIPPAAQMEMLRELGYAGISWTEGEPERIAAVRGEAEKRGLKIFAVYCSGTVQPDGTLALSPRVGPIIEAMRGSGAIVWLHLGGKGPDPKGLNADASAVQTLREVAAKAQSAGLSVALYPHVNEWTEHLADAVTLAKLVDRPNFGVTFNLCHSLALGDGEKLPELLREASPYLKTVTINGADAGVSGAKWDRLIQTLDRGSFDVAGVLRLLKSVGFTGPIGVQGYGLGGDRRENLSRSIAAWRRLSAEAAR
jgi:sugar phosphate isomerase/epimerase